MPLYFLKGEQSLPSQTSERRLSSARRHLLSAGILAIMVAAVIQACGLPLALESRLPELLGLPSPHTPRLAKVVFLPLTTDGSNDSILMETALVLRGLAMLHPSLVLLAAEKPTSADSEKLLENVKHHLREQGIPLLEGIAPSAESLWRPVPLCRYLLPRFSEAKESLGTVPGSAPPEGSFLSLPQEESASLPLLSITSSGEIVGSLWWKGLMHGQPKAPVWLLADHLLLLPNHTVLRFAQGGVAIPRVVPEVPSLASDEFLLRMEERERGNLSPEFDSLWENTIVVVGPASLHTMVSALSFFRGMTARGSLSLTGQGVLMVVLMMLLCVVFSLRQRPALLLAAALLVVGALGCCWALSQGVIPPILPWVVTLAAALAGSFAGKGPAVR